MCQRTVFYLYNDAIFFPTVLFRFIITEYYNRPLQTTGLFSCYRIIIILFESVFVKPGIFKTTKHKVSF